MSRRPCRLERLGRLLSLHRMATASMFRDGGPGRTRTYNQQFPSQQLNTNGFNDFPKFLVGISRQF
jgi:hypothetical protein